MEIKVKAPISRGHNPTPILSKGGVHQPKKEVVPELDYELSDYYEFIAGEVDSPASFLA